MAGANILIFITISYVNSSNAVISIFIIFNHKTISLIFLRSLSWTLYSRSLFPFWSRACDSRGSVELTSHMIWHSCAAAHRLHMEHLDFLCNTFHVVHFFFYSLLPILHFTPYSSAHTFMYIYKLIVMYIAQYQLTIFVASIVTRLNLLS